jgi:iron complex transport system ATP-binding protein
MILEIVGLAFSYNSHPVLNGIEFSVAPGEILTVLGPNGVGKTTLLKCINAIQRPKGGTVYVDGKDVLTLSPMKVARTVGYVAQRNEAPRVTAFDAVLMGRRPHVRWRVSRQDMETVNAALSRLGLTDLSMRYVDQMSGGELQKVAIARALVQEPSLMLLDEPTSSLDLRNQAEILGLLRRVINEHKIAAVMTMHDLNTAFRYTDKCLFLKDGNIFFAGSPPSVDADIIEAVYGLPVDVYRPGGRLLVAPKS